MSRNVFLNKKVSLIRIHVMHDKTNYCTKKTKTVPLGRPFPRFTTIGQVFVSCPFFSIRVYQFKKDKWDNNSYQYNLGGIIHTSGIPQQLAEM